MENTRKSITGFMKAYLTDKNGKKRKVYEGENTISPTLHLALSKALNTGYDISLLPLFTDDLEPVSPLHGAGIMAMAYTTGDIVIGFRSFITTASQPSSIQARWTGIYTNNTGATIRIKVPQLGKDAILISGTPFNAYSFYEFIVAANSAFSQDVPAGEALTIVWTITFTVH